MKHTTLISLLCASTLAIIGTAGCGKKDGEGGGKMAPLTLDKLGVKVTVPSSATQSEMLGDIMVQAPGYTFSVREAKGTDPKTIAEEKSESEMFTPKNATDEKLADGYVYRFENKGSMGANYHVHVRRDVGGKTYYCSTMLGDKSMADNAVNACKSIAN